MRYWVFDLDGTLISFPVDWDGVREDLRELTGTKLEFAPFFLDVQKVIEKKPLLKDPIMKTIDDYEAMAVPRATLEEGAREVLQALSASSKLSLVTMQGRAACDQVLERLRIGRFFLSRFTREDSMDRPTQLRSALESLEASPAESTFVGDRINDLKAARALGTKFVMIRKRSDSPDADVLYRSMAEFAASRYIKGLGA